MANTEPKILTLHHEGKKGVNILKRCYDLIATFIIGTIGINGENSNSKQDDLANKKLSN